MSGIGPLRQCTARNLRQVRGSSPSVTANANAFLGKGHCLVAKLRAAFACMIKPNCVPDIKLGAPNNVHVQMADDHLLIFSASKVGIVPFLSLLPTPWLRTVAMDACSPYLL